MLLKSSETQLFLLGNVAYQLQSFSSSRLHFDSFSVFVVLFREIPWWVLELHIILFTCKYLVKLKPSTCAHSSFVSCCVFIKCVPFILFTNSRPTGRRPGNFVGMSAMATAVSVCPNLLISVLKPLLMILFFCNLKESTVSIPEVVVTPVVCTTTESISTNTILVTSAR